jgi:hypothetical protein
MDLKGNSKFNVLNGENRLGIEQVIPEELNGRYEQKKYEHYDRMRLKIPISAESGRVNLLSRYH